MADEGCGYADGGEEPLGLAFVSAVQASAAGEPGDRSCDDPAVSVELVSDDLWGRIEPLLPVRTRRRCHPGRLPLDDRKCLQGILFVPHTGIQWEWLSQ